VGDGGGAVFLENRLEPGGIAEIGFEEEEVLVGQEVGEVPVLVDSGIVVVEVIKADDAVTAIEEDFGEAGADEAGGSCDQDGGGRHAGSFNELEDVKHET
jgi:hypothetical protein